MKAHLVLMVVLLLSCGTKDEPIATQTNGPPAQEVVEVLPPSTKAKDPKPTDDDPLADLDIEAQDDESASQVPLELATGPGCVGAKHPQRIWPKPATIELMVDGDDVLVVGYAMRGSKEEVFAVRQPKDGLPTPLRRISLPNASTKRSTAPAIAKKGSSYMLAVIDGEGVLYRADVKDGGLIKIADEVDTQFAPAMSAIDREPIVSWTGRGSISKIFAASYDVQGKEKTRKELSPSVGGCAPYFVSNTSMIFVEAREAMSVLHQVEFSKSQGAGKAKVLKPVANLYSPAHIAAVDMNSTIWVAYSAIGQAAATATGLVNVSNKNAAPKALVPSLAYGPLGFDVSSSPTLAVFALTVAKVDDTKKPIDVKPEGPRSIAFRTLSEGKLSAPAVLPDTQNAKSAKVGYLGDSAFVVVYSRPDGVFSQELNCR